MPKTNMRNITPAAFVRRPGHNRGTGEKIMSVSIDDWAKKLEAEFGRKYVIVPTEKSAEMRISLANQNRKVFDLTAENEALKKEIETLNSDHVIVENRLIAEYQKHRAYELKMEKELIEVKDTLNTCVNLNYELKESLTAEMGRSADLQTRIDAMTFMSSNELRDEIAELKTRLDDADIKCDERMKRNLERQEGLEQEIERLEANLAEAATSFEMLEIVTAKGHGEFNALVTKAGETGNPDIIETASDFMSLASLVYITVTKALSKLRQSGGNEDVKP